jgi:dihydropyrimidinase
MAVKYDVLVQGGLLVSGSGVRKADVGIKGEIVASVEARIAAGEAKRVIDASGKYVMPGVIDVHTHPVYEDDLGGLSFSAAHGGTTTVIHFAYARPGMKLVDTIKKFKDEGAEKSYLDFGVHGALFDPASQIKEIPEVFKLGVSSFKMFMTYAKLKWMTDDYHLAWAMDVIGQCGGLAMVHAESGLVTDYFEDRSLRKGEDPKKAFLKTRPDHLEADGIFRALSIAAVTDCPVYIVHVSTARGVWPIEDAKGEGRVVYAETCPQYLSMTDKVLQKVGPLAKIGPPLRTEMDRLSLWEAIRMESIDTIASDHAPKAKKVTDPFFEAPYGSPQAETMLTVVYDEGVNTGRIGICRVVELLSEHPARIFGLYPKKGVIRKGADADIVLFDPNEAHTIRHKTQHSKTPYTLYEGRKCVGRPVLTMLRGRVLVEAGEMKGKPGSSNFVSTKISKVKLYG